MDFPASHYLLLEKSTVKLMKNATEGCSFISLSRSDQKATEGEKKKTFLITSVDFELDFFSQPSLK